MFFVKKSGFSTFLVFSFCIFLWIESYLNIQIFPQNFTSCNSIFSNYYIKIGDFNNFSKGIFHGSLLFFRQLCQIGWRQIGFAWPTTIFWQLRYTIIMFRQGNCTKHPMSNIYIVLNSKNFSNWITHYF